jgi:hypothetical protein
MTETIDVLRPLVEEHLSLRMEGEKLIVTFCMKEGVCEETLHLFNLYSLALAPTLHKLLQTMYDAQVMHTLKEATLYYRFSDTHGGRDLMCDIVVLLE